MVALCGFNLYRHQNCCRRNALHRGVASSANVINDTLGNYSMLNSGDARIGMVGPYYPFTGSIDDVRVYNYARTPKQIISDMNGGHSGSRQSCRSAVGQWNSMKDTEPPRTAQAIAPPAADTDHMDSPATYGSGWTNNGKFAKPSISTGWMTMFN